MIVNVFSVILCILCFCILFYIVGSCKFALLSGSYFERINDDDDLVGKTLRIFVTVILLK